MSFFYFLDLVADPAEGAGRRQNRIRGYAKHTYG